MDASPVDVARNTSAIIGGIAGGGLGAIWACRCNCRIWNRELAPGALEKAKAVVGRLYTKESQTNQQENVDSEIVFFWQEKNKT